MREMKDSGIEWIGIIPSDWKISRIKYVATFINGDRGANYPSGSDLVDEGIIFLTSNNIHGTMLDCCSEISKYITTDRYSILGGAKIALGDIIYCLRGSVGNCAINKEATEGTVASSLVDIRPTKIHPEYLNYILQSPINSVQTLAYMNGSCAANLSAENVANYYFIEPPVTKQRIISAFLDSKCSEIDSIISDIQSQIEALEEYKRSVITEAVTKGLDPDVEMRDSGVQWIGDIPAHWITHPLYFYFGVRKNKNALGLETNLLSLSYGKIIRKDINSNGGLLPESFNTYNIIEKDDIIIRPTDLQNDKRSLRTGIAREHGIITSAYIAMKAIKSVNLEYFHYLLHAYDVMKVFYNMGNGVRQGLNFSEFSRLMVFEPTIEEQNAIVEYLKEKCDEIDLAIAEKKQQIETIEEYKKSLIFEYVTGKKEVQA